MNSAMSAELENLLPDFEVILPQEKGEELTGDADFFAKTFEYCIGGLDRCDCVVAMLEGPDADSGTCVEIGYAYARGVPVIGVRTDFRSSEDRGLNLMASMVCAELIWEPGESSVEELAAKTARAVRAVMNE